jgi:hypothetical protein
MSSVRVKQIDVEVTADYQVLPIQHHSFDGVTNIMYRLRWSTRGTIETAKQQEMDDGGHKQLKSTETRHQKM